MAATGSKDRDNGGQYKHRGGNERLCVCGHPLGAHAAAKVDGERPCFWGDDHPEQCNCVVFKPARGMSMDGEFTLLSSDTNGHTIVARRDIVEVLAGVDAGERGRVVGEDGQYVVVELKDGTHLRCSGHNVEIVRMEQTFALRVGDKVQTDHGPGKVIQVAEGGGGSIPGMPYRPAGDVKIQLTDGRTDWVSPRDVSKMDQTMADSVHVTTRDEETTMAYKPPAFKYKVGDKIRYNDDGPQTGRVENCGEDSRGIIYSVSRDGGGSFYVREPQITGKMSANLMSSSASCPYCSKTVSMSRGALGDHRVPGGVCDGSGKSVARVEMGRAVLSTTSMGSASGLPDAYLDAKGWFYCPSCAGRGQQPLKPIMDNKRNQECDACGKPAHSSG